MTDYRAEATAPVVMYPITLVGREAVCTYSHADEIWTAEFAENSLMPSPQPSSVTLPYFEYRGDGSIWALAYCANCNLGKSLHYDASRSGHTTCGDFDERGPATNDAFYCGCRGLPPPPETGLS